MYLISWSSQGGVIKTDDGRTITIAEGVAVSVSPQEIQPVQASMADPMPVSEPAPEVVPPPQDNAHVEPGAEQFPEADTVATQSGIGQSDGTSV